MVAVPTAVFLQSMIISLHCIVACARSMATILPLEGFPQEQTCPHESVGRGLQTEYRTRIGCRADIAHRKSRMIHMIGTRLRVTGR